jgi:hypothetical protein
MNTPRKSEVLNYLDSIATRQSSSLPLNLCPLDKFPIHSRLHVFADSNQWAIILEILLYDPAELALKVQLLHYGNCLTGLPLYSNGEAFNGAYIHLADSRAFETPDDLLIDYLEFKEKINSRCHIDDNIDWGISIKNVITVHELVNRLRKLDKNILICLSSREHEIRKHIPADLQQVLCLDEWYHDSRIVPSLNDSEHILPSQCETYRQIASVIEYIDTSYYSPTIEPNSNWVNWPESGSM